MSSPENIVEFQAHQQKLFFIGGIQVNGLYNKDRGYFMFDPEKRHMTHIPILGKQQNKALERTQFSLNSIKIEIDGTLREQQTKDYEL